MFMEEEKKETKVALEKKNQKNILVIVAVALVVLVAVGFLAYTKFLKKSPSEMVSELTQATSLKELIAKNIPQTCTYHMGENNGTIYLSGGKMRGDFETTAENAPQKSHMIIDGQTTYIWSEGQTIGYKLVSEETQNPVSGGIDINQSYNYSCKPWIVNETVFTPPAEINFMNFGEMPNIPTSMPSGSQ
jgi:hypothetical protein